MIMNFEFSDDIIMRFIDKISFMGEGCWMWRGAAHSTRGYGRMVVNRKEYKAHQISWCMANNKKSVNYILHSCDVTGCVNPKHLSSGNHFDNMRDAAKKGRLHMQKRTECPRGHAWKDHSKFAKDGGRFCGLCMREAQKKHRLKKIKLSQEHTQRLP